EGFEGARERRGIHARTGIRHLDQHVIPRRALRLVRLGIAHVDRERAAAGQAVARVVGKIDEGDVQLSAIDLDGPQVWRPSDIQNYLFTDCALEQTRDVADAFAYVEALRVERLPARKGEKAPRQVGPALGTGKRRFNQLRRFRIALRLVGKQVETAHDRRQVVVEIVRQPAGKVTDRLHALDVA